MSDLSAFYGPNAGYVLELYDRYTEDPSSVDADMQQIFASFDPSTLDTAVTEARGTAAAWVADVDIQKIIGAVQLATGLREYGHRDVHRDPIGSPPPGAPEIENETYGLSEDDLKKIPA